MQATQTQTPSRQSRLEILIRLYETGQVNERIERVLDKVIEQEIADAQTAIQQLDVDLRDYEATYNMTSEEFQRRFQSGELGDRMEYIEWFSLFTMRRELKERLQVLGVEK